MAAAERLMISQSAISTQLKQFERAMGTTLFIRLPRGMTLTPAGHTLVAYADRIFDLSEQALQAVQDVQGLRRGSLLIGASPTIATYFLPSLLVHYQQRFPQIQVQVETHEAGVLDQRLTDGLIDLALRPGDSPVAGARTVMFMKERFLAVASPDHPLTKLKRVPAEALAKAMVTRQLPSATGSLVLGYFMSRRIYTAPLFTFGSIEAVKQAVLAGLGVTILPAMVVSSELSGRRLINLEVDGLPLHRPLYQLSRTGSESKASIAFSCLLKHAVRGTLPKLSNGTRIKRQRKS